MTVPVATTLFNKRPLLHVATCTDTVRHIVFDRMTAGGRPMKCTDFAAINGAAVAHLPTLLRRWLPNGRLEGREYTALNPKRADRRLGSFRINIATGKWADFATGDKGGDVVSLAAYLASIGRSEAARRLAVMLGVRAHR